MTDIESLLAERALIEGHIMCENAKSRGWDAHLVASLQRQIRGIDMRLRRLGYVSNRPKHLMGV